MSQNSKVQVFASTLRTRLFLSLLPFAAILIAVGAYATIIVYRLGRTMDCYRSIMAMRQVETGLSRIERGFDLLAKGQTPQGRAAVEEGFNLVEENLRVQARNSLLPGESALTRSLSTNFDAFRADAKLVVESADPAARIPLAVQQFQPRVQTILQLMNDVRLLNEEKSADATSAWSMAQKSIVLIVLGTGAALLICVVACFSLAWSLLRPIKALTEATQAVAKGDLEHPTPILANDELGVLAQEFSEMALQLKRYRDSTNVKMLQLNQKYEATLASFPDPIFVLDAETRIDSVNPAAKHLAQSLGLVERLPASIEEFVRKALKNGQDFLPEQFDAVITLRAGRTERFFLPRILLMRDNRAAPFGVAVVLLDVTRFRLLDDAKSNLVGTVSHELRTPLTSIRMVFYMLLERTLGPLTPSQIDLVTTACENTERALRILNDLLDLSRLERGQLELQLGSVSPEELVLNAVEEQREPATIRGVTLESKVEPGLATVKVDVSRLRYVFANLISNAVKYSPAGSTVVVEAGQTPHGGIRFSVRDRGPGIPSEYHDRIFERFFRVPGQGKSGTGLGLSIAREIVVAHGGRIGLASEPGQGSEFFFILPVEEILHRVPA